MSQLPGRALFQGSRVWEYLEHYVGRAARLLDSFAGVILALTAGLVVANIIGRTLLGRSIQGTYEMVGFLTAAVVGLALGRCALENGHIAVSVFLERLPRRLQRLVEVAVGLPAVGLLFLVTREIFRHGMRIAASGEVSPTMQLLYYPFVYIVGMGFLALTLAVLVKLMLMARGGVRS